MGRGRGEEGGKQTCARGSPRGLRTTQHGMGGGCCAGVD